MKYDRNLPDCERIKILSQMLDRKRGVVIVDGAMRIRGHVELVVNHGVSNHDAPRKRRKL